jgi:hypothetical protein
MSTPLIGPRKIFFGEAVTRRAEGDDRIVVLSAHSGVSSGFGPFRERHPDRYLEFGIQEHGVTGVPAGLATTDRIPVFAAIAAFGTCRKFDAFRNDVAYMKQNVKIVGRNGGMTYSDRSWSTARITAAVTGPEPSWGAVALQPGSATQGLDGSFQALAEVAVGLTEVVDRAFGDVGARYLGDEARKILDQAFLRALRH